MGDDRDEMVALNNAEWCAAVWRSHGLPVERTQGMWFCPVPTPRYYPNVVTVDAGAEPAEQTALIAELARNLGRDLSVKDSFACLDLSAVGLQTLFDGRWLIRRKPQPPVAVSAFDWRRVSDGPGLRAWEQAWRLPDPSPLHIFRPELLDDERVCVLAGLDETRTIRAGRIAFNAAGATGITNIFGSRREFLDALVTLSAPSQIVCYERGSDLTSAANAGFEILGSLRVWARAA